MTLYKPIYKDMQFITAYVMQHCSPLLSTLSIAALNLSNYYNSELTVLPNQENEQEESNDIYMIVLAFNIHVQQCNLHHIPSHLSICCIYNTLPYQSNIDTVHLYSINCCFYIKRIPYFHDNNIIIHNNNNNYHLRYNIHDYTSSVYIVLSCMNIYTNRVGRSPTQRNVTDSIGCAASCLSQSLVAYMHVVLQVIQNAQYPYQWVRGYIILYYQDQEHIKNIALCRL